MCIGCVNTEKKIDVHVHGCVPGNATLGELLPATGVYDEFNQPAYEL